MKQKNKNNKYHGKVIIIPKNKSKEYHGMVTVIPIVTIIPLIILIVLPIMYVADGITGVLLYGDSDGMGYNFYGQKYKK